MDYLTNICGIYYIGCKTTGKVYIGSSIDIGRRLYHHLRHLERGVHGSIHLQRSWDKYGKENFVTEVIETCSKRDVLKREQYYLDTFHPWDGKSGFNTCRVAGNTYGRKHSAQAREKMRLKAFGRVPSIATKEKIKATKLKNLEVNNIKRIESHGRDYEFIAPDGTRHSGRGLEVLARKHGLDGGGFTKLLHGKVHTYAGWHLPSFNPKEYHFLDDLGQKHVVKKGDLQRFSRAHGVDDSRLGAVSKGSIKHHKGWTLPDSQDRLTLIHKDGRTVNLCRFNKNRFVRSQGMSYYAMCNLLKGRAKTFNGWRLI